MLICSAQRLRAQRWGLPPLAYQYMFGHRYSAGHVVGDLQMKESEKPWLKEAPSNPEPVDVVLYASCISEAFPNIILDAMDIFGRM